MDYSKAKEMMRLQQEMSKVKKELANTHIEAKLTVSSSLTMVR
jgi:DNA-binding protein YbaB